MFRSFPQALKKLGSRSHLCPHLPRHPPTTHNPGELPAHQEHFHPALMDNQDLMDLKGVLTWSELEDLGMAFCHSHAGRKSKTIPLQLQ